MLSVHHSSPPCRELRDLSRAAIRGFASILRTALDDIGFDDACELDIVGDREDQRWRVDAASLTWQSSAAVEAETFIVPNVSAGKNRPAGVWLSVQIWQGGILRRAVALPAVDSVTLVRESISAIMAGLDS